MHQFVPLLYAGSHPVVGVHVLTFNDLIQQIGSNQN